MVDRYSAYLYRFAYSLVGNAADAEDVLQETFLAAFCGLRRFEERSSIKTWLSQILIRQTARRHRTRHKHKALSLDSDTETLASQAADRAHESTATQSDIRLDVRAVLDALPPVHREVVVLRELQGMTYEEIADVLGVPVGTVDSRLFRARQALKANLKDYLP